MPRSTHVGAELVEAVLPRPAAPEQPHEHARARRRGRGSPSNVHGWPARTAGSPSGSASTRRAQGQDLGVDVGEEPDHGAVLPIELGAPSGLELGRVVEAAVVAQRPPTWSGTTGSSSCGPSTSRARRAPRCVVYVAEAVEPAGGARRTPRRGRGPPDRPSVRRPRRRGRSRRSTPRRCPTAAARRSASSARTAVDERREVVVEQPRATSRPASIVAARRVEDAPARPGGAGRCGRR